MWVTNQMANKHKIVFKKIQNEQLKTNKKLLETHMFVYKMIGLRLRICSVYCFIFNFILKKRSRLFFVRNLLLYWFLEWFREAKERENRDQGRKKGDGELTACHYV